MLQSLSIRNILLIDQLDLEFGPGLTALTGETGAGKSILLDSLGACLGWQGRQLPLRDEGFNGEITTTFLLAENHPVLSVLEDNGFHTEEGELILRKLVNRDGRSRSFVNDRRASNAVLRMIGRHLVEMQGQGEDHHLLNPAYHLAALDRFGQLEDEIAELSAVFDHWKQWVRKEHALEVELAEARKEEDYLRHSLEEIRTLSPELGEEEKLDHARRRMQQAEKLCEELDKARVLLGNEGAVGASGEALRWLERTTDRLEGDAEPVIGAIERAMIELEEAERVVEALIENLTGDQNKLEETEERLFEIRALARKHQLHADQLPEFGERLAKKLEAIGLSDHTLTEARAEVKALESRYAEMAERLSQRRSKAAAELEASMARELTPLKFGTVRFQAAHSPKAASDNGIDDIVFEIATVAGAKPTPLGKAASGGERSRLLLALKLSLASTTEIQPLMIFDEIDRGVGGATADAVGKRLSRLAQSGQVLAVTHSPQVAACADHHWKIVKKSTAEESVSQLHILSNEERKNEIARMLSGEEITEAAREAAHALLQAGNKKG